MDAVVFAALVFFVFAAFVFFVFVAFVVSCAASCANTGIANEKAIMPVKSSANSFFMLGLDLLKNYVLLLWEQAWFHIGMITQISYNVLTIHALHDKQTK